MAQLVVIARPSVAPGYQLAGVKTYAAQDAKAALKLVEKVLVGGETSLLAIDEAFLDAFPDDYQQTLREHPDCLVIGLPSGERAELGVSRRERLAEGVRRAIGFQLPALGEEGQEAER